VRETETDRHVITQHLRGVVFEPHPKTKNAEHKYIYKLLIHPSHTKTSSTPPPGVTVSTLHKLKTTLEIFFLHPPDPIVSIHRYLESQECLTVCHGTGLQYVDRLSHHSSEHI
jgi:hypothetical protein